MDLDQRVDRAIDRTVDRPAVRLLWALLSVGAIYACIYYLAALIGGIS